MKKNESAKYVANEVRLLHKEVKWALQHIANIYEAIKLPDQEPIEDPNQLKLFDEEGES